MCEPVFVLCSRTAQPGYEYSSSIDGNWIELNKDERQIGSLDRRKPYDRNVIFLNVIPEETFSLLQCEILALYPLF